MRYQYVLFIEKESGGSVTALAEDQVFSVFVHDSVTVHIGNVMSQLAFERFSVLESQIAVFELVFRRFPTVGGDAEQAIVFQVISGEGTGTEAQYFRTYYCQGDSVHGFIRQVRFVFRYRTVLKAGFCRKDFFRKPPEYV